METGIICSAYSKPAFEYEGAAEGDACACFHFSAEPRRLDIDGVAVAGSGTRYLLLEAGQRFSASFPGKSVQIERTSFPAEGFLADALRLCLSRSDDRCFSGDRRCDALFALLPEILPAASAAAGEHVLSAFLHLLAASDGSDSAGKSLHSTHVQNALDIISHEYPSPELTVSAVSKRLYISPAYFGTLFKQECETSFAQYLLCYRLEKARELIRHTNKLILEIASETGFPNTTHFCTRFREAYGVTPLCDRKAARAVRGR